MTFFGSRNGTVEMMIIDWFSMTEGLSQELGGCRTSAPPRNSCGAQSTSLALEILVYAVLRDVRDADVAECGLGRSFTHPGKERATRRIPQGCPIPQASSVRASSRSARQQRCSGSQLAGIRSFHLCGQEEESGKFAEQCSRVSARRAWKSRHAGEPFYESVQ